MAGDDNTEIDDNDSILEMAKRLDAASVISDPSFIEGPHTKHDNYDNNYGHPSRGAYRMDDIASEEEEDSSSISSCGESSSTSSEDTLSSDDNDDYQNHRERYEYDKQRNKHRGSGGRKREGGRNRRYNHHHRSHQQRRVSGDRSDRRRRRDHRRNNHRQQQPPQQQPSQPYYDGYDHHKRGLNQQQHNNNIPYQGGHERKYSPTPPTTARGVDPMMMSSIPSKKQSRGGYRDDLNNDRYDTQEVVAEYEKKQKHEKYHDGEDGESVKRSRTKMILIPLIVILIIGAVVAVAVVIGKGGDDDTSLSQDLNNDNTAFQPIPVPTTSPTYFGLYQCQFGKSGPTPTKGCLGFVQCSALGTATGPIQYCSSGTLYDVRSGVCDFADNVSCATSLPTTEEIAAFTPQTATPPTPSVTGVVPPLQKPPSITVGPITTRDHKLLFRGFTNPGQMDNNVLNRMVKNVESYLNIFYSARVISAYNNDDYVLDSIGNVTIQLTANKFEFVQNNNGRSLRRQLQANNGFSMIYQQTTKYDTINSAITAETIVSHPYQDRYQDRIVSYLKASDPVFSSLTGAIFVEDDVGSQPAPVPVISTPLPTRKPTNAPTEVSVIQPAATDSPTGSPVASETYTIQGITFFDENNNGKFEYDVETTFKVWATLKLCNVEEGENDHVDTKSSGEQGLYTFVGVKEGEYYIDFFKPQPNNSYNFTIPQVAGDDDSELDSDVIELTRFGGKTACFTVGPGFDSSKLINAGYKLNPTPNPTTAPSKSPTQSPVDVSFFCADVTTTSDGSENYDFFGCQIRCGNGFSECPGSTECVFADDCVEPL